MKTNISNQNIYFWSKITNKDKALFYEHLFNLVDGGVSIIQAVKSFLYKTQNPKFYQEISNLLIFIDSGDSFSISMKKLPFVFNKKEIAIIESGENSGTMQKSFSVLARQLREQEELKSKVIGALTYPIIIILFLIIAVIVIMIYVIPKIKPLFEKDDIDLPFATQSLIFLSDFVVNHFVGLIILIALIGFFIKIYINTETGKRFINKVSLDLPLVGIVYKNYIISQLSTNLSILIGSGVPIIKTFYLTGESTNNIIYIDAMNLISKNIEKGYKITESIEKIDPEKKYFSNDFVQMIEAGEKTSTINKVCDKLSLQYKKEVENSLSILIKWVEPLAILIAGIFVLWFAFAIFSAVLKITETVS